MADDKKTIDDAKKALQDIKLDPMSLDQQLATLDNTVKNNLPAQTLLQGVNVIQGNLKSYESRVTAAEKAATALKAVNSNDAKKLLQDLDKAIELSEKAIEKGRAKLKQAKTQYDELVKSDREEIELMKSLGDLAARADKAIAAMKDLCNVVPAQTNQMNQVKQKLGTQGLKTALPGFQKQLVERAQAITKAISLGGEIDAEIKKAKPYRLKGATDAMTKCKQKKSDILTAVQQAQAAYNKGVAAVNTLQKAA